MEYRTTPGRLRIGETNLYYERTGAGPPIVFLHGLGGNHLSWWNQVPYFMRWYECITLDQRSFGLSNDAEGTFNASHPSDLNALLDHLKIERAVLVGQSMGGWTIVGCALERPDRIAAMVMCDTHGGIVTPEMKFSLPTGPMPIDSTPPLGSLPTYQSDYFARRPNLAFLYDELRILGARPPADAGARLFATRHDLARVRERLTMPVLCLVGENDTLIPPNIIKEVARAFPNSRYVSVPDSGHSVYFEQPEVFNQILRDYLIDVGWK
jgi:3-oxoadipate enol-lactonase